MGTDGAARRADDEAARRAADEAARRADDEAARRAADEAARKAADEAARRAGYDVGKRAAEEAWRKERLAEEARRAAERRRRQEEEKSYNSNSLAARETKAMIEELERLQAEKEEMRRKREELVKRHQQLQKNSREYRRKARDNWKKKFYEEKKKTPPLDGEVQKLKLELDSCHKRVINILDTQIKSTNTPNTYKESVTKKQNKMKIRGFKLEHELDEIHLRVENIKLKLTGDLKLRSQVVEETKNLSLELDQKKTNANARRNNKFSAMGLQDDHHNKQSAYA